MTASRRKVRWKSSPFAASIVAAAVGVQCFACGGSKTIVVPDGNEDGPLDAGTEAVNDSGPAPGDATIGTGDASTNDASTLDVAVDAGSDSTDAVVSCDEDAGSCAVGTVCHAGACVVPRCGDEFVTAPEECDLGSANAPGSGCEVDCRFSCAANDSARGCTSTNACLLDGTCDSATHKCSVGGPGNAGASCGTGMICQNGSCVTSGCGDAVVTAPEQCDNGSSNGPGTGCESDCTFSCTTVSTDCSARSCLVASCDVNDRCAYATDSSKNETTCGTNLVCRDGACVSPSAMCGNEVVEAGEDCDFGGSNAAGSGCEANCRFSCTATSCVDTNPCNEAPSCAAVVVGGKSGKKCEAGAAKARGASCGTGSICLLGVCAPSVCGDGYRDGTRGEQCDDSNVTNMDSCDASCRFEHVHRVTALKMQFGIPGSAAPCTVNRLGSAIAGAAQSTIQSSFDSSVADGSLSVLFTFEGGDLTGQTGSVRVGSVVGSPITGGTYSGTNDLDWWYRVDPIAIDASRLARESMPGTFTAGALTTTTGTMFLRMAIGSSLATLNVTNARIRGSVGELSVPKTSTNGQTPGHVASENLVANLSTFGSFGGTNSAPTGEMCGDATATSLANTPISGDLLPGGSVACVEGYTAADNKLLDVIVNGCTVKVFGFSVTTIRKTQPDQMNPSRPVAGQGAPYTFSVDAKKHVTACKDKSNATVDLATCLASAAYSSYFKFRTDRVILK